MSMHETIGEVGSLETVVSAGLGGGLIGGIAMGAILHGGADLMEFIGALYGSPTVPAGWLTHLIHSAIIGLVFALVVSRPAIDRRFETMTEYAILGMVYASGIGLVVAGVVLPISMRAMGVETLPEPILPGMIGEFLTVVSVGVAHLIYGLLLGVLYFFIARTV